MKNENISESCDTETETCSTTKSNRLTTVKTIYARAAVVLLALNFCLTGYVVFTMNQTTQAQIDGITGVTASGTTTQRTTTAQETPQTTSQESTTPTPITTRDQ